VKGQHRPLVSQRRPNMQTRQIKTPQISLSALKPAPAGLLQRACACASTPGFDGACDECRRRSLALRPCTPNATQPATPPVSVYETLRTPGAPLDSATRARMEARFGHDFSRVRIHTDAKAAQSAQAVNALAYTVGHEIAFGAGQYAPQTQAGRRLLAHELAHVVQQQGGPPHVQRLTMSSPHESSEIDAERLAEAIASGGAAQRTGKTPLPALTSVPSHRLMRAIAYDADCQPRQEEVEGNISRAQRSAARWARAALTSLTTPDDVASLLRRHFDVDATDATAVGQIHSAYEAIVGYLEGDAYTYHCRPESDARCQGDDGQEYAGFAYPGGLHIYFCDPYPYQNFFGHKSLIDTLLHEAAHAHDASFNHDTYESDRGYPGANALTNADSYASFARDAALGRGQINLEVSVGALLAAEPQFYIAAGVSGEVGGPVLDVLNLKAGFRLAFLPGTATQPTRGLEAAEIGLRINPIRERVYVDVTTGAFFGANFTDTELMAGIANRLSAGYRGDRVDLGLDLNHLYDLVGDEHLLIVGVRGGVRF
jgi:hypothetical protein